MNIYGSLMGIFDEKNKNIYVETLLHALAQPRKGVFMDIQKNKFMNIYGSLMDIFDQKKKDIYVEKNKDFFDPKKPKPFLTKNTKTFLTENE